MFSTFLIIIGVVIFLFGVLGLFMDADSDSVFGAWFFACFLAGCGFLIKDIAANDARPVETIKTNQPITIVMKCPHCGLSGMSYTNVVTKTQTVEKE